MFTNSNSRVDTFVDLLVFVVDNHVSDHDAGLGRVPTYIIKFISINLLQTLQQVQQSLKVDVDVDQLVKNLTDMINFHLHKSEGWREVQPLVKHQSCEIDFQNMWIKRRKLAEASANSSTSSENHRSLIYEYSTQITQMLMEMVITFQPSSDSLYSHVKNAVLVLHAIACNAPCLIKGELINVVGADDEIVKEQYKTVDHRDMFEGASACLYNLGGTTSYMISTLQCLRWVPELKSALFEWHPLFEISKDHLLTAAMRDLFKEIDKNAGPVEPRKFLQLFREKYPKSSQLDNNYNPKDAQTCWIQLLDSLSQSLKSPGFSSENIDIMKDLFDIRLVGRVDCQESGNKNPEEKSVGMLKWRVSREVDHLHEGLRYYLDCKIDGGSFLIDGLPRYLTIRFLRGQGKANREINLLEVDVYDLCSDELRVKLEPARKMAGLKVSEKSSGFKMSDVEGSSDGSGDKYKATCRRGQQETQLTGFYDLVAMVSHNNRKPHEGIVGPGHYTNFMKYRGADRTGPGLWIMYMDDKRILIRKPHFVEQIMRGGDGLAPYICLYKARVALVN